MVRHQAVRVHPPFAPATGAGERGDEELPVAIVEEDVALVVSAHRDVIDPAWDLGSGASGHATNLRPSVVSGLCRLGYVCRYVARHLSDTAGRPSRA